MALTATIYSKAPRPYGTFGREIKATVLIVASGSYVSGGDILDLSNLDIPGAKQPYKWEFWSGTGLTTYGYSYVKDAAPTLANGKLYITTVADGAELSAGAYPGGLSGDTILATFYFKQP